ncbi:MAG: hypothetical protein M3N93_06890 [Acidobacteriota bacterium]|nr:hypothetical protein [Acidobacteriota bacterium]
MRTSLSFFGPFLCAIAAFAQPPTVGRCPVFPADNIWNTRVDNLPVSPNSPVWVDTIGPSSPLHPDFASGYGLSIGIPYVAVTGAQTKYPATFQYQSESDPGPYAIPLNAPIEGGANGDGDRHAISVDQQNCILYELFSAYPSSNPPSWSAGSGAIFNLLSDSLRPQGWTSADAAGLPILAGLIRYDEIVKGEIRHAVRFTAPHTRDAWVWPARHEASSLDDPSYPPMGARFRLNAAFDISGYSAINQVILTALKRYGLILADNGSSWFISGVPDSRWNNSELHFLTGVRGSDFEAVDVSPLMTDPNSGKTTPIPVSMTLTGDTATAMVNSAEQFTAHVAGNADQRVTWDVNGLPGGNASLGTIDVNGLYTAPSTVPTPRTTVAIHANSLAAPAAASASLIISATRVGILPANPGVLRGATQKFTASVQDIQNAAVAWSVNGIPGGSLSTGTIKPDGTYVAPVSTPPGGSVQVTATYSSDPLGSSTVTVNII